MEKPNLWTLSGKIVDIKYGEAKPFVGFAVVKLQVFRVETPIRVFISCDLSHYKKLKVYLSENKYGLFSKITCGDISLQGYGYLKDIPKVWYIGDSDKEFKLSTKPFLPINFINMRLRVVEQIGNLLKITNMSRLDKDRVRPLHSLYVYNKYLEEGNQSIPQGTSVNVLGRVHTFTKEGTDGAYACYKTIVNGDIELINSN